MLKKISKYSYYASLLLVLSGVLGSLYFSEILKLPPCNLCWYQRIMLYPLIFIIPVGILKKDNNLPYYVLPLTLVGSIIAFYQVLLQNGFVAEDTLPCSLGVSCSNKYFDWFGFMDIPFLSLLAFLAISGLMYLKLKSLKKENNKK